MSNDNYLPCFEASLCMINKGERLSEPLELKYYWEERTGEKQRIDNWWNFEDYWWKKKNISVTA